MGKFIIIIIIIILLLCHLSFVGSHFSTKCVTSEGAITHNVSYYQQLTIAPDQVSFYANNCFELLPIVSTAIMSRPTG